jgi:hypothetical protein
MKTSRLGSMRPWRVFHRLRLRATSGRFCSIIEIPLDQPLGNPNGRAYNRAAHLPERRKMMQQWADYLDELADGGKVIVHCFGRTE